VALFFALTTTLIVRKSKNFTEKTKKSPKIAPVARGLLLLYYSGRKVAANG